MSKYKVELLDRNSRVIKTNVWNADTSFYSSALEYANVWQDTVVRAANYRVTPVIEPDPAEEAYEVYRTTIANRRGQSGERVRPDWENLTPEVRDAFTSAMKTYVAKGGK